MRDFDVRDFSLTISKEYLLIFLQTYIRGLVGWELAKGTTFAHKFFSVPRTHVLVQILVNFGGIFFGKLKGDGRRIVDEKAQQQFSKISG